MKKDPEKNNIYAYLENVLENGSEADIALARRKYWRQYKANWRKQKRKERKEFTISLSAKEFQIIKQYSKHFQHSNPRLIKETCLAYLQNNFVVPDRLMVGKIRALLAINYNCVQQLSEERSIPQKIGVVLMRKISELESKVLGMLEDPKFLELVAHEEEKSEAPEKKSTPFQLLQTKHK